MHPAGTSPFIPNVRVFFPTPRQPRGGLTGAVHGSEKAVEIQPAFSFHSAEITAVLPLANDRGKSTMMGKVGSTPGPQRTSHSPQRLRRQVMLVGASNTTMTLRLLPA
jgi:hypothetical protein